MESKEMREQEELEQFTSKTEEKLREITQGESLLAALSNSICDPFMDVDKLIRKYPGIKHFVDKDAKEIADVYHGIAARKYCAPLSKEKLSLITGNRQDRLAKYLQMLINYNQDGSYLKEINQLIGSLSAEQVANLIIAVIDDFSDLKMMGQPNDQKLNENLTDFRTRNPHSIRLGIIRSIHTLLGDPNHSWKWNDLYNTFLHRLSSSSPALRSMFKDAIKTLQEEENVYSEDGSESEVDEDDEDNYDHHFN